MVELYILGVSSSGTPKIDISSATITLGSSLTYNGSEQTQTVTSVVVNGTTLVENTDYAVTDNTGINAGNYMLSVVGMGNYTGTATQAWSIAKANGSVSVNPSSLNVIGVGTSDTATLSIVGDGEISVVSNDASVATVERSGNTLTVTSVANGTANITITLAAGTNYTGDGTTLAVNVIVVDSVLANNTPEQIQAAAQAGIASSLWSIGAATSSISINAFGNMAATSAQAYIIGFDHNSNREGKGIHFQFGKKTGRIIAFVDSGYGSSHITGIWFNMNNSSSDDAGWKSASMRTVICSLFLSDALPTNWKNVIIATKKFTDNTGDSSDTASYVTSTSDKIFLLSEWEVFGARSYANSTEQNYQVQYDYYKNGNSKIKYKHNATTTACNWWLRSPSCSSNGFCVVSSAGNAGKTTDGISSYGFAPAFRIA